MIRKWILRKKKNLSKLPLSVSGKCHFLIWSCISGNSEYILSNKLAMMQLNIGMAAPRGYGSPIKVPPLTYWRVKWARLWATYFKAALLWADSLHLPRTLWTQVILQSLWMIQIKYVDIKEQACSSALTSRWKPAINLSKSNFHSWKL